MINHEAELKLQAWLDGELPESEAREVSAWMERDAEARALAAELRHTSEAFSGHEAGVRLPETREFFWSKIEREIEKQAAAGAKPERRPGWLEILRQQLVPVSGVALLLLSLTVLLTHSAATSHAGQYARMEVTSDDMGTYTFRDQTARMTMVWFYDRDNDSEFTDPSPLASLEP